MSHEREPKGTQNRQFDEDDLCDHSLDITFLCCIRNPQRIVNVLTRLNRELSPPVTQVATYQDLISGRKSVDAHVSSSGSNLQWITLETT